MVLKEVIITTQPYKSGTRKCDLCDSEKLLIIKNLSGNLVNKKSELVSKCRHQNKFLLKNFKSRLRQMIIIPPKMKQHLT